MNGKNFECIGNCRLCPSLSQCPADPVRCDDCGAGIKPGEGVSIEVETVDHGRHGTKMITVCPECFRDYYQGDESIEWE